MAIRVLSEARERYWGIRKLPIMKRLPLWALFVLVALVFLAVFGSFLAPDGPNEQSLRERLTPPFWQARA